METEFSNPKAKRLTADFYTRTDVVQVARELLGKLLVTEFDGQRTSGIITETEAYRAPDDRASHAYGNRRTPRTEIMFQEGGRAYIYLCYGIHHLFNVVTATEGVAHAVLVRAIEPFEGVETMLERRGMQVKTRNQKSNTHPLNLSLTNGPGALSQALGLRTAFTGQSLILDDTRIWVETMDGAAIAPTIAVGKRIGVDYAGECAEWPWRFWLKESKWHK